MTIIIVEEEEKKKSLITKCQISEKFFKISKTILRLEQSVFQQLDGISIICH